MTKARYIGSTKIDKNYLEMEFEYRGKTYFITRALSWTACSSDYTLKSGSMTESKQHKREQERIDNELDNPKSEIKPYNNSAEKAFDALLDYCLNGNENAFDNL